ncbi:MAG: biopolymer transporter ExbD [Verrucomicrobia bacterium]|nr:biopolymer transporter ExbD [Verrucomicrobiota bacterium]
MKIPSLNAKRKARIEIIPLIDIMFFLLATFMMVSLSMVKNLAVPVHLPKAATSAPEERKNSTYQCARAVQSAERKWQSTGSGSSAERLRSRHEKTDKS